MAGARRFEVRLQHERLARPSLADPTAPHASVAERLGTLRELAPHLFHQRRPKGNGHDHAALVDDPW